jgi:uncharacterized protein
MRGAIGDLRYGMTAEPTIDYEGLAQEAMRGVVRTVLVQTAKSGLTGDHHFYISFDTEAPGVSLSKRLKEKYPREMTIVLQHRFWDLAVTEQRFEVKLTFDGIPERLVVPFAAIKVFFDPSVRFGLQFEDPGLGPDARAQSNGVEGITRSGPGRAGQTRKTSRPRRPRADQDTGEAPSAASPGSGEAPSTLPATSVIGGKSPSVTPVAANAPGKSTAAEAPDEKPETEKPANSGGAEIVSLDKFRKK